MASGIPSFKMILVGEYGVGKSSLFRRFIDNSFIADTGRQSSIGLDSFKKTFQFDSDELQIELWDTAGLERFATLSASYFQSSKAALLCYSLTDRESFGLLSQHLLDTVMQSSSAKIFLCGNKVDLIDDTPDSRCVSDQDIVVFKNECDMVISGSYKVSCKSGYGVKEMFQEIASIIYNSTSTKFDPCKIRVSSQPPPEPDSKKCC